MSLGKHIGAGIMHSLHGFVGREHHNHKNHLEVDESQTLELPNLPTNPRQADVRQLIKLAHNVNGSRATHWRTSHVGGRTSCMRSSYQRTTSTESSCRIESIEAREKLAHEMLYARTTQPLAQPLPRPPPSLQIETKDVLSAEQQRQLQQLVAKAAKEAFDQLLQRSETRPPAQHESQQGALEA
uniref:Uncharacterized protein n=1 Tax=Haptolina brevifila TaxID=156173 RepID=A0A7S2GPR2_9EUKA|mmetsp:Transcript_42102/g.84534  ORF Transcript_42102/g.84534 Transcript_42102/m.84534 type:complete len:184 (+) Transcript_42102:3-554(+)